jgi:hypothetical protein
MDLFFTPPPRHPFFTVKRETFNTLWHTTAFLLDFESVTSIPIRDTPVRSSSQAFLYECTMHEELELQVHVSLLPALYKISSIRRCNLNLAIIPIKCEDTHTHPLL